MNSDVATLEKGLGIFVRYDSDVWTLRGHISGEYHVLATLGVIPVQAS